MSQTERSLLETALVTKEIDPYMHLKAGLQNQQVNKKIQLGGVQVHEQNQQLKEKKQLGGLQSQVKTHFDFEFACVYKTKWPLLQAGLHCPDAHPWNP